MTTTANVPATMPTGSGSVAAASVLPADILPYIARPLLNPMQAEAIPRVLGSRRNLVIAAPTGSGKTLLAEVALLHECRVHGRAGVYLAPMRAIAAEKHDDWQRLAEQGLRVYKTTGEDDAFDPLQALNADIIVATPEKWDSISRRVLAPELVDRIGAIVMDEVHLVADGQRGAGQEAMLARLPLLFPAARIVAMSGTLANADAIARWLDADLYESSWRPIRLSMRVAPYQPTGRRDGDEEIRNRFVATTAGKTDADGAATLVFCGSRAGVESCARYVAQALALTAPPAIAAGEIRARNPTLQLALARGVGFHHAGLERDDRATVERLFRSGAIRVLVATSTVAAGVNLPARVVIVRDLQLGTSDLTSSGLLQMAGRAGRPGLETEGYCYVVAPEPELARVRAMLRGQPIGSRLGDDLPTHVNTEIALGLVRSRADLAAWYERTLHRHVAPKPQEARARVAEALRDLLKEGFVTERDGMLEPTLLGLATNSLMIRVSTSAALEEVVAARTTPAARTDDPTELEQELLIAACGRPAELDDLSARRNDDYIYQVLSSYNTALRSWSQGRVEYLAVAACLLSGLPVEGLPMENPVSTRAAAQRELPRYLTFMARRANERLPGAPDVMVAAADLAAALEHGVAQRGAGSLLDALKRAHPAVEARRRRVQADYARLRDLGVESLTDATPHLGAGGRAMAEARAASTLSLGVADDHLVAHLRRTRRPVRVHARIGVADGDTDGATVGPETLWSGETAEVTDLKLAPLVTLGAPGPRTATVEAVVVSPHNPNVWTYNTARATATLPGPRVDYAAVERVLGLSRGKVEREPDDETGTAPDKPTPPVSLTRYRMTAAEYQRLVADAPPLIARAAALLARDLPGTTERIDAVSGLLRRRALDPASRTARSLGKTAGASSLSSKEAAELAAALLWAMGVPARPLVATLDGAAATVPAMLHEERDCWYWLCLWPDAPFEVHHRTVDRWRGRHGGDASGNQGRGAGWDVIRHYLTLSERQLPLARAALTAPPVGASPVGASLSNDAQAGPAPDCPQCGGLMRERSGRNGRFWGCARYPDCKGAVNIAD